MSDLLADAPLLSAWLTYTQDRPTAFTIPGHKGAATRLWSELGQVLATDVPLFGGLDTVKLTGGVLDEAERRAAALWGADWCRFSTGGSTHANQVATLAAAGPGDTVLVTRSAHRSTLSGLVLAGVRPVWLPTMVEPRLGLPIGVAPATLERAIADNPRARAVFLVEPSYLGTLSDLPALVAVAHAAGLPVVVDQAWGAHLGFHPSLPGHALTSGADAIVTSAHKTLPAYSQASLILARTERLDRDRLDRAFDVGNTTSPAGSILASIDGARALLAAHGPELLAALVALVDRARGRLRSIPGMLVPGPADFPAGRFDPTKLVILLPGTGAAGVAVERELVSLGFPVEMADHDTIVPIVTMADTEDTLDRLVDAIAVAVERHGGTPRPIATAIQWGPTIESGPSPAALDHSGQSAVQSNTSPATVQPGHSSGAPLHAASLHAVPPPAAMTPRDAFFARHRTVDADAAVGHVCAELVAPYPPGVPVLVPGEVITADTLAALRATAALGTRIAYAADPTLRTLQIVEPD